MYGCRDACKRRDKLGGQLNIAANSPLAYEFAEIGKYFMNVLPKLGVRVKYGVDADADWLRIQMLLYWLLVYPLSSPLYPVWIML